MSSPIIRFHQLLPLLSLALLQCGTARTDVTDTRTNWLLDCSSDAQCGSDLSCECGICTVPCSADSRCTAIDADSVCETKLLCSSGEGVCVAAEGTTVSSGGGGSGGDGDATGDGDLDPSGGEAGTTSSGGESNTSSKGGSNTGGGDTGESGGAGAATSCASECIVTVNDTSCANGNPDFHVIWLCPTADVSPPPEVLDECQDMATGLPRWCCPETVFPECL